MNLPTLTYKNILETRGPQQRFWIHARDFLVWAGNDPGCSMEVHRMTLEMPLSHALPYYLRSFPLYDRLPGRLSEYVHAEYGFLNCIDVGANVGDTIAALSRNVNERFLAIEPNPKFNMYLRRNFGHADNIEILDYYCSSSSEAKRYMIDEHSGTASITVKGTGTSLRAETLDNIVSARPEFADCNLLKIDTDGHDFDVIAGAQRVIRGSLPIIIFEAYESSNPAYVEECLGTLTGLRDAGYGSFLIYDNYGFLMGRYSLSHLQIFRNLLFYQLTSPFHYFDIVVMPDDVVYKFLGREQEFFIQHISNKDLQLAARSAAAVEAERAGETSGTARKSMGC